MCLHPIIISYRSRLNRNSSEDAPRVYGARTAALVTCGKCEECLKRYQNDWTIRNYYQFLDTKVGVFFTLTYSEDNVPIAGHNTLNSEEVARSVFKRDVQLFLKRFREYCRKNGFRTDWKYFITSEYGPVTLRPHYHGLLHNVTLSEFMPFRVEWSKRFGFVSCREISCLDSRNALQSARYVSKYCAKGMFENPLVASGSVYPTFHLISKGLGLYYLTDARKRYHLALDFVGKRDASGKYSIAYLDEVIRRSVVHIAPCTYSLPRYYKEKIFSKSRGLQSAVAERVCQRVIDIYEGKLEFVQTDKSPRARYEASIVLHNSDLSDEMNREAVARESIAKFYKKSKI